MDEQDALVSTKGFFDRADFDYISGWVTAPELPDVRLMVAIELNGEVRYKIEARDFRQDLLDAGIGDGRYGFGIPTHAVAQFLDDSCQVQIRIMLTDEFLPGGPRTILRWEKPAEKRVAAVLPSSDITGVLDDVNYSMISGWAFDQGRPHIPVSIDLFIDSEFVLRADADQYREDLKIGGLGSGHCAFLIPTPLRLFDGRPHELRIVPTNLAADLTGSPKEAALSGTTPIHHFARLHGKLTAALADITKRSVQFQSEAANVLSLSKPLDLYSEWSNKYVKMNGEEREALLKDVVLMESRPVISILMPTYNTEPKMLRAAVDSVRSQLYPHWQLCIADDCSTNPETLKMLHDYASTDVRIKIHFRQQNGHISEATNTALAAATGQYIALLDHDDVLVEHALAYMARAIVATNCDILYSDEDKMDASGVFFEPHFKPAFNYTLLLSNNYICHFLVARRELAIAVGGFRTETNGSQDHDFILRLCAATSHDRIVHVPHVLYHWRVHQASTALETGTKPYVLEAGRKAVSNHLEAANYGGNVKCVNGYYEVEWPVPAEPPLVSIIIPTRDCADVLSMCLKGLIRETDYRNIEIIIIDNGSVRQETFALFEEAARDPRIRILPYQKEFNYSAICNYGAAHSTGSLLLMLNNDVEATANCRTWLRDMVGQILRPGIGAVGARLLYPDSRIQHGGVICGLIGLAGHAHKLFGGLDPGYFNRLRVSQELSCCTAACLLIKKELFDEVGGFDSENLPVSFNDVDLCLRIREAGYQIVYMPGATLLHHESYSRGLEDTPAKIVRSQREISFMHRRWAHVLSCDPAYSPSLTLDRDDFSMDIHRGPSRDYAYRFRELEKGAEGLAAG